MFIQDIKVGNHAKLEVKWLNTRLEIDTTVVAMTMHGVVVTPYKYHGSMVDFSQAPEYDISIDLHYMDETSGDKGSWQDVEIRSIRYEGTDYHMVTLNSAGKIAYLRDKRKKPRLPLNVMGTLTDIRMRESYEAKLLDMHDNGIGVLLPDYVDLSSKEIKIHIDDTVRGKSFSFDISCRIVNEEEREDGHLYGCKILRSNRTILQYLYLKHQDLLN